MYFVQRICFITGCKETKTSFYNYFTAKIIETFGEWFLTINNCLLLIYYGELQTHFFSRQREQSRYLKCFNAHLFIYKLLFHTFDTSESWGFLVSWCWENNPFWTLKLKHVELIEWHNCLRSRPVDPNVVC